MTEYNELWPAVIQGRPECHGLVDGQRGQQVMGQQHLTLPGRHSMTRHGSICQRLANKRPLREMGGTSLCGCLIACGGRGTGRRATHWCPSDAQRLTLGLVRVRVVPPAGSAVPARCAGHRRASQGTIAVCVHLCPSSQSFS